MFPAVIASQCAHWRGNPHPRREHFELKRYKYTAFKDTDCHTSDIGHWFAMTSRDISAFIYLRKKCEV
jgi:hypothetical protein